MMKSLYRKIAMVMTFLLVISLFGNMNVALASTATPTFIKSNIELDGAGETYQLEIKDKVTGSKYAWTSSNTAVATVTDKGVVTSVNKGTATIKCKITYPSKKTKTLSCKITVTIPAAEITISNANDKVNGAHVMMLGSTMDFNCDLAPLNSSDKVYWSIGGGDAGCIRIDNAESGMVTAIKAGKVILKATAAKASTQAAADLSIVNDAIIIEVVKPTATVNSASITESNKIVVVFDSPVNPSTVIGANGALSDNIELTMSRDTKLVVAQDPGKLTAGLSADAKTLTITSEKPFSGNYGINFTDKIQTADGTALEQDYKRINFIDNTPPEYAGTTLDETGMIATVNFTEHMNFDNLVISDVKLVTTKAETANADTLSKLRNVVNYTIAADKKSLTIDLTRIAEADKGHLFSVYITGVTDLTGNLPSKVYIEAFIQTDNTPKPQARIITLDRTGYNTLTATFDRAISFGGLLQIPGGSSINGIIDTSNNKKVNYTISEAEALYTGTKIALIGLWKGYNVDPTDTSTNKMIEYPVNFTIDKTNPVLLTSDYNADKAVLTLTYNKDVSLRTTIGTFSSTFTSLAEDIRNTNITYTMIVHNEGKNIIKLQMANVSSLGTYTFTMDQGFVSDNFRNQSLARAMVINNSSGTLSELPGPLTVRQNADDFNKITLRFQYKLDKASAETLSNYKIAGVTLLGAELTENDPITGATVVLTVADGAIEIDLATRLTITGVKGYNNSYSAITSYQFPINLEENKKPEYVPTPIYDNLTRSIKINFSEAVKGTMTAKVSYTLGATNVEIPSTMVINASSLTISLGSVPPNNTILWVDILSNNITDMNGNKLTNIPLRLPVIVTY